MLNEKLTDFFQHFLSAAQGCHEIREADPTKTESAKNKRDEMGMLRGRPLIYPLWPTGKGSGPFIEMADGSVKLDMITGIGVSLFGYAHPDVLLANLRATFKSPSMQGTLLPGDEYARLGRNLLEAANAPVSDGEVGSFSGVWLTTCGTMANELALKILRQKKSPAYKVITFERSFAGRSQAMQEMTDEPKYREGQPVFDQFIHIPFYDESKTEEENVATTQKIIGDILEKEKVAGFAFEMVQGEGGGFRHAPNRWWQQILGYSKEKGLAIWADEVQTFGRTGEFFAFQRFGVADLIDVVSVAKPIYCGAVLWSPDYAPKAGLIGGTFAGSGGALAMGARTIELLEEGGFLGPHGKIRDWENFMRDDLIERKEKLSLNRFNVVGGMITMELLDGKLDTVKKMLQKLYQKGLLAFSAGKDPVMLRFLPAMGVLTRQHWNEAMDLVEEVVAEMREES